MTENEMMNGWTFEETVKTAENLMEAENNIFKWDVLRHLRDFAENFKDELEQYRETERRLQNIYGECDGLLETVVQHLENHENIKLPDNIIKARLLTDEDVDKWEQLKSIGTIEEFKDLKEKSVAKKPHSISIADDIGNSMVECPICHARSDYDVKSIKRGYCWKCGQKLDWSK